METLYTEYGQLMIQLEILNGRITKVKQAIAEGLNKPKEENYKEVKIKDKEEILVKKVEEKTGKKK